MRKTQENILLQFNYWHIGIELSIVIYRNVNLQTKGVTCNTRNALSLVRAVTKKTKPLIHEFTVLNFNTLPGEKSKQLDYNNYGTSLKASKTTGGEHNIRGHRVGVKVGSH